MQNTAAPTPSADKPAIHLVDVDYDVIAGLALSIERRAPELSSCCGRNQSCRYHDRAHTRRCGFPSVPRESIDANGRQGSGAEIVNHRRGIAGPAHLNRQRWGPV